MSRKCELTNKKPMTGNRVSHAVNRTNRRFLPNLKHVKLISRVLKKEFSFKIATHTLRTIDFKGGLDQYLINTHHRFLTKKARTIKKEILLRTKIDNTS